VIKHCHRLPREVVESVPVEIFKTQVDTTLCSLLYLTLPEEGVEVDDPELPSSLSCSVVL